MEQGMRRSRRAMTRARDVIPKRDVTKRRRFFIIKFTVYREAVPGKTMKKEL